MTSKAEEGERGDFRSPRGERTRTSDKDVTTATRDGTGRDGTIRGPTPRGDVPLAGVDAPRRSTKRAKQVDGQRGRGGRARGLCATRTRSRRMGLGFPCLFCAPCFPLETTFAPTVRAWRGLPRRHLRTCELGPLREENDFVPRLSAKGHHTPPGSRCDGPCGGRVRCCSSEMQIQPFSRGTSSRPGARSSLLCSQDSVRPGRPPGVDGGQDAGSRDHRRL